MRHLFLGTTLLAGLFISTPYAFPQDRDEEYHRDRRDENYWQNRLFERVHADLDHLQAIQPVFSGEQFRLAKAKQDLNELQSAAAAGRFDDRNLDEVMSALERVQGESRLSDRDRVMIADDLNRLREYREHHDRYYRR
jgi:hypothetical protein